MKRFNPCRVVVLLALLVCTSAPAMAQSVAELESALKNCKNSWRTMSVRYQNECGDIANVESRAQKTNMRLIRHEMPPALQSKETRCWQQWGVEKSWIMKRWRSEREACANFGKPVGFCEQAFKVQASDCDRRREECLANYHDKNECRQLYDKEKNWIMDRWRAARKACVNYGKPFMSFCELTLLEQAKDCDRRKDECLAGCEKEYQEWVKPLKASYEADIKKIEECGKLEGQFKSVVDSCLEIEKNLNAAKAAPPPPPPALGKLPAPPPSLPQQFAPLIMRIEGPDPVVRAGQSLFKAVPDAQMAALMSGLRGALIFKWFINGREMGRGTENFFYTVPAGYRGPSIDVRAELYWFDETSRRETPLKQASKKFPVKRVDIGKIPMKVTCAPSVARPGTSVQCTAQIQDPAALKKLNELASVGGSWGYYWYVNNSIQNHTGASISATIPKTGGAEVVARLMVTDPTAAATLGYEADYAGTVPAGPQPQEVGRAGVTLQAQPAGPGTTSNRKKYGPFAVPWGSWLSTGVNIKQGESFTVKATGAYKAVNQNTDVKTCGPDGCGHWRWFVLKAKIGNQKQDVGSSGGWTAEQNGVIELGSPRGGEFVKEDAGNCTGSLSVEIWVDHR